MPTSLTLLHLECVSIAETSSVSNWACSVSQTERKFFPMLFSAAQAGKIIVTVMEDNFCGRGELGSCLRSHHESMAIIS
jgi:hypothetical protein